MAISMAVVAIAGVFLADPHEFRSDVRPGAPALRLRGGDHRRPRLALGHARRRHGARRRADGRLRAEPGLGHRRRTHRVSRRAARSTERALPQNARRLRTRHEELRRLAFDAAQARSPASPSLVVVCGLIAMPWWATRAQIGTTTSFLGIVAMAQMWNLLAGFGGLVSIGQQAFIGLGSYVAVMVALQGGVSIYFAVPARGIRVRRRGMGDRLSRLPAARRLLRHRHLGRRRTPEDRLRQHVEPRRRVRDLDHLGADGDRPMAARGLRPLDRDRAGRRAPSRSSTGMLRSPEGLAFGAVRDSEAAAESLGVSARRVKLTIYLVSAAGLRHGRRAHGDLQSARRAGLGVLGRLDRDHVLLRRDRRHRHDRGADPRRDRLSRPAAEPRPVRRLVPDHPRRVGGDRHAQGAARAVGRPGGPLRPPAVPDRPQGDGPGAP